jgi:hypothetical protein
MSLEHGFHLAQINVARALAPLDDPIMADFVAQLDAVNAAAEASPGFVWRFKSDEGASSYFKIPGDERLVVNLTVWEDVESLKAYAYRGAEHAAVFRARRQWFEKPAESPLALWWVAAGHIPTIEEGFERLALVRAKGPTGQAFTFKTAFSPDGLPREAIVAI